MDMLCDQFDLSKTIQTYRHFEQLLFKFGQKFTCSSGTHDWPAAERYAYYGLILPQNVLNKVNIAPIFVHDTVNTGIDWLETVTLI